MDERGSNSFRGTLGVIGVTGGGFALMTFLGLLGEDGRGSIAALLTGIVLLAIGFPLLVIWGRAL